VLSYGKKKKSYISIKISSFIKKTFGPNKKPAPKATGFFERIFSQPTYEIFSSTTCPVRICLNLTKNNAVIMIESAPKIKHII
jgi:hypothetical protein